MPSGNKTFNNYSPHNLKKGRRKGGHRFHPWGVRREVRLADLGIEVPNTRGGHRVIRSDDIGQQWLRTQAAIDYSFEVWQKLLAPIDFAAPIVRE